MDFSKLIDGPCPDDTTLDQVYVLLTEGRMFRELMASAACDLRVRFMRWERTGLITEEHELPGSTTIGEFRAMAERGEAFLSLDGGGGDVALSSPRFPVPA